MHQPIREYLEAYLRDPRDQAIPREFHTHLKACGSCAGAVETLGTHARLLRTMQDSMQAEPRPGFYARVLTRIDQERMPDTFWSPFLIPAFGRRLAIGCAALVVALGTYLVSTEPGDGGAPASLAATRQHTFQTTDGAVRPQDRDAVLVNLASFHE